MIKRNRRSVAQRALRMGTSALMVCAIAAGSAGPAGAVLPLPDPIFTPVKVFPSNWATKPGHAQMYGWGAATMLDGSILIGDYWNYRIQRITLNPDGSVNTVQPNFIGNQGFKPGQNQAPYGIAVDPTDGNIFVADTDRYKIDVYSPSGTFIMEYGVQGSGVNQFLYPSRITIRADGTVYVADTWSNQVVVENVNTTTKTVTELGTFGSFGTGSGCKWKQPHGMAWYYGPDGSASINDDKLFVVDTNNKQIDVFGSNPMAGGCNWLYSFGQVGTGQGDFKGDLRGIAIDQNDPLSPTGASVYVVDAEGNKVRKFTTDGAWMRNYGGVAADPNDPGPGQFSDGGREVTVDQFHHVWVGDMPGFRAQVFDGTLGGTSGLGNLFSVPDTYSPPSVLGFNGPRGVAVDANGNYFVTDTYNQRILKYDKNGNYLTSWGSRGRDDYAFNYTRMIAIDPTDQSVVVADTDNHRIKKFTNGGQFVCQAGGLGSVGQLMRNPHGIDVGPDGTIFVTDTRNGLIKAFDPDCNFLFASTYPKGSSGGSLTYPRGIAVDPSDGSVWVVDSSLDIVKHYAVDEGAKTFTYLGSVGSKGTADNQWNDPFDVEVDASGRMFVADTKSNKIKVWDVSGGTPTFLEAYGGGGTKLGKFQQPQGLDLSPYDGSLWVCEQKNERVQQLTLAP